MPRTLGGLFGFAIMATVTVVVGTYIYNKLVAPLISGVLKKAA
jgi:hypothetical protein